MLFSGPPPMGHPRGPPMGGPPMGGPPMGGPPRMMPPQRPPFGGPPRGPPMGPNQGGPPGGFFGPGPEMNKPPEIKKEEPKVGVNCCLKWKTFLLLNVKILEHTLTFLADFLLRR